jgi:hypothetical protein
MKNQTELFLTVAAFAIVARLCQAVDVPPRQLNP